jgi:hypothetical protein
MLLGFHKETCFSKDFFKNGRGSKAILCSGLKGDNLCLIICHARCPCYFFDICKRIAIFCKQTGYSRALIGVWGSERSGWGAE